MRARAVIPGTILVVLLVIVVLPASAGGATWLLNGEPSTFAAFAPGQQVEATASIWLPSVREEGSNGDFHGGPQHGPYYGWVFARPRPHEQFPPPLPDDPVFVGEVVFHETDEPKLMALSLTFELPELAPGEYGLVTCNEGCERQIADLWMTGFTVVEDAGQALLASRVERLEHRLGETRGRISDKADDIQRLRADLEMEVRALEDRIEDLNARPAVAREPARQAIPTWPLVATAVFVVLAIVMVFSSRGNQASLET